MMSDAKTENRGDKLFITTASDVASQNDPLGALDTAKLRTTSASYSDTVAKLNENNRRLRSVAREMYQCLLTMPSGWEDEEHHVKRYKDELTDLGVL